jgi:hypothetical protein
VHLLDPRSTNDVRRGVDEDVGGTRQTSLVCRPRCGRFALAFSGTWLT